MFFFLCSQLKRVQYVAMASWKVMKNVIVAGKTNAMNNAVIHKYHQEYQSELRVLAARGLFAGYSSFYCVIYESLNYDLSALNVPDWSNIKRVVLDVNSL